MKVLEFISLYQADPNVQMLQIDLHQAETKPGAHLQIKGLAGSADAVVAVACHLKAPAPYVFVMQDREEAFYFLNDLQALWSESGATPLLLPTSYKKPYQYQEIENANVLQRAEVLAASHGKRALENAPVIVTYPEALTEMVINQRSLVANTFSTKIGDKLDTAFLAEMLSTFFDCTEFVYEAGQFSIRGGIIDVFSFASEMPYRIELYGDVVESIRFFDPETQLTVSNLKEAIVLPNVQTRLLDQVRVPFPEFVPANTVFWFKDFNTCLEILDKCFEKATEQYELNGGKNGLLLSKPKDLFLDADAFKKSITHHTIAEFGTRFHFRAPVITHTFNTKPQQNYNKDFNLLTSRLALLNQAEVTCIISSNSPKQLERLHSIFEETDRMVRFQPLYIALRAGFEDEGTSVSLFTDHQIFQRFHRAEVKEKYSKSKAMTLRELKTLQPGDFVTHIDYGVGRFAGLEKIEVNNKQQEAVRMVFRDDDFLFVSIHSLHKLSRYSGKEGGPPSLSKLGSGDWEAKKSRVKRKVKDIAKELIALYARRKNSRGFQFTEDGVMQTELESSFIYEDTPDQAKATADTKRDMQKLTTMDRLVCGDVGFGKTEIAVRAAFKAVYDKKQVAILVPTTILAMQHYKTFRDRLAPFACTVDYINRFKSDKQIKETLAKVKEGKVDILIGTHRIASKDVIFKDMGLMIIDEEQKFGVKTKERLKEMRVNVDCLTLTATPIPRTLQFSLMGARDLSIIATPPPNRQPVTTEIHAMDDVFIRDAIVYELKRGGQVFFVHNRVSDIESMGAHILRLVPDARVAIAHGQMDGTKLENVMLKFIEGDYDILVSTNIIESGLDIPNANTIIINRANYFGLSDLHQMRGRVGRSNKKAFCYLLAPPLHGLSIDSRKRLQTLEEFNELGDGFKVAMRDLDIRGAGDLLGAEQSGFITDVGFDAYHKILDEAIQELKETEFKDLFADELNLTPRFRDSTIETDFELIIPDNYVANISERLALYSQLDGIQTEAELSNFQDTVVDRFGPLPKPVTALIKTVRLRWLAQRIGFEKLVLKERGLKGFFRAEHQDKIDDGVLQRMFSFMQANGKRTRLKETNKKTMLGITDVKSVEEAISILSEIAGPMPEVQNADNVTNRLLKAGNI